MSNILNESKDYSFNLQDLIKYFNIDKITKNPISYEMDKLKTLNRIHLGKDLKEKLTSKTDEEAYVLR